MKQFLLVFLFACSMTVNGQSLYRISAGFTVKEKQGDKQMLQKGWVYYDLNTHKLLYRMSFPAQEDWLSYNGFLYRAIMGKVLEKKSLPFPIELTIFHLALSGDLSHYGLDDKYFSIEKVEKDQGLVITTYVPKAIMTNFSGKLLVATKDKQLYGLVVMDAKGKVVSRQQFKDYEIVNGVAFPERIIEVTEGKKGTGYKVSTYEDIVVNELGNEKYYDYSYFEQ